MVFCLFLLACNIGDMYVSLCWMTIWIFLFCVRKLLFLNRFFKLIIYIPFHTVANIFYLFKAYSDGWSYMSTGPWLSNCLVKHQSRCCYKSNFEMCFKEELIKIHTLCNSQYFLFVFSAMHYLKVYNAHLYIH